MDAPRGAVDKDLFMDEIDIDDVPVALSRLISSIRILHRRVKTEAMTGAQVVAKFSEMFLQLIFSQTKFVLYQLSTRHFVTGSSTGEPIFRKTLLVA